MSFKQFNHLNVPEHWERYFTKYPQGMTILESLFEWVSQVDSMTDNVNKWNIYLDEFVESFDSELQGTLVTILTDWQQTGFLDILINAALQTQIDEIDKDILQLNNTKLDREENESITLAMLSPEIKASLNGGTWVVNINTDDLEDGAITKQKLRKSERINITEFSPVLGVPYKEGFVAKWGNIESIDRYHYKEFNVVAGEEVQISAHISATEGALAVFRDSAGNHVSFLYPTSELGTKVYQDEPVVIPEGVSKLVVSSLKTQREIILKKEQYVDTNLLKSKVSTIEKDVLVTEYTDITDTAEHRQRTYVGNGGKIEELSNYHTYLLDVLPTQVYYISAEITATSGRLAVFTNTGGVVETLGDEKKQYTREKVIVPNGATRLAVSVTNSRTAKIETGNTMKINELIEAGLIQGSTNNEYEINYLRSRVSDYESMFDFQWKPYEKGYVTIVIDDGLPDLYRFYDKMVGRNLPLTAAIPTHRLGNKQDNGQTLIELMHAIEQSKGEIMSHSISSEVFTELTTEKIADERLRQSKLLLNKQGFKADGFVKPGGTGALPTLSKFDHIVRKYYRYGFSAGAAEPYYRGRSEIHGKDLATIKSMIDKCENEKNWTVFYAHTFNNEVDETIFDSMLDYLTLKNIDVVTPKQMYNQYKGLTFK